jgi:tetratricopeptide (TPR) repeat protein
MATYPFPIIFKPTFAYQDHLMYNQYVADLNQGITRASTAMIRELAISRQLVGNTITDNAKYLSEVVVGASDQIRTDLSHLHSAVEDGFSSVRYGISELRDEVADGFYEVTNQISALNTAVSFGLNQVAGGIASLRSDFDIAMGKVIAQFEISRSEMQTGLARIVDVLENRRKIDAQEHFQDALDFYKDGCRFSDKPQWFTDSLKHFLASVESYERNPIAQLHIGHIYHYQKEHQDFNKALHHYRLCYTYGEANESDYKIAAQGYFYAGWLCAAVPEGSVNEAVSLTKKSLEFDKNLSEAHYNLSKYYSLLGEEALCVAHLRIAIIEFDRNYCLKAGLDPDFNAMRAALKELLESLRHNACLQLNQKIAAIDHLLLTKDAKRLHPNVIAKFSPDNEMRTAKTYFSCLDAMERAATLLAGLKNAINFDRQRSSQTQTERMWAEDCIYNCEKTVERAAPNWSNIDRARQLVIDGKAALADGNFDRVFQIEEEIGEISKDWEVLT